MEIKSNITLASFNTYRVGGKADYFTICKNGEELKKAWEYSKKKDLPILVLGNGSNILISDEGFRGIVVKNEIKDWGIKGNQLSVGSGFLLPLMVSRLAEAGITGFEGLAGIPGTVGAGIKINASAWGNEISENLILVEIFDINNGTFQQKLKKEIRFDYRKSSISETEIIVGAKFRLIKGDSKEIKNKMEKFREARAKSQPKGFSCGSFFKNPKGDSAGRIIESLGFKGQKVGGAVVSEKHANFILNDGTAKAEDIYNLSQKIKEKAKKELGIALIEEVKLVGKF